MESPPHPEGSSRATKGIFRGRAAGLYYNAVDDEDLYTSSTIGHSHGTVYLYYSSADPSQLNPSNMTPSMKTTVAINTNLGPVLKIIAQKNAAILRKLFIE